MGYRSDVGFVIHGPKDSIFNFLTIFRLSDIPESELVLKKIQVVALDPERYQIRYFVANRKWYDNYPEVTAVQKLYNLASADASGDLSGRFLRIGEDDDDVESDHFGEDETILDYLEYIRRIEPGFSMEDKTDDVREHRREN